MNRDAGALPIVLTATVAPVVESIPANPEERLAQYIQVLRYCKQFAPVFFLENSGYPLKNHPEFTESQGLRVRQLPRSSNPDRGKGYQEFEMLDAWLASESVPPERWLKISGRYQLLNLANILREWTGERACELLIDRNGRSQKARTYLFGVTSAFYRRHINGVFLRCDDRTGEAIEHVLFRKLKSTEGVRYFKTQPRVNAQSGSSGTPFPTARLQWSGKQCLRWLNTLVDKRYIRYNK